MSLQSLKIGLFDPGMTALHRVGLAGLYMTLRKLDPAEFEDLGGWNLDERSVELHWKKTAKDFLEPLIQRAFGLDNGVIHFAIHDSHRIGDRERIIFHEAILNTYLQHPNIKDKEKNISTISFDFEDKQAIYNLFYINSYAHQLVCDGNKFFRKNGTFNDHIKIVQWLYPGGIIRHEGFKSETSLYEIPERALCLLFLPVGSLYFMIYRLDNKNRRDLSICSSIVLPDVRNIEQYARAYIRYLDSPVEKLYANSMSDSGLMALIALNSTDCGEISVIDGTDSCTIFTLGKVAWSKQTLRTGVVQIKNMNLQTLNQFALAIFLLPNRPDINKDGVFYIHTSVCRGLIADNISQGRNWFEGFSRLMATKKQARLVSFERRGLKAMVEKASWNQEADKLLVKAVHKALRSRYGELASRARESGEQPRFDREVERIRTGLMRSKNAQTLRAELADLFARGGLNKVLQEHWPEILPLYTGPDWQKARDLALLGLASYVGKGTEQMEDQNPHDEEEDE